MEKPPVQPPSMESRNKKRMHLKKSSGSASTPTSKCDYGKPPRPGQAVLAPALSTVYVAPVSLEDEMDEEQLMIIAAAHAFTDGEPESSHESIESPSQDEEEDGVSNGSPKTKRRSNRKKGVVVSPKAVKKGRSKRSNAWKLFKEVLIPSKNEPGKMVTKAKCRFCYGLFAYTPRGSTSSLLRHMPKCTPYMNKKRRMHAQRTLNYDPDKPDSCLLVTPVEYDHDKTSRLIAKMIIVHEYPFRMVEITWFNVSMRYMNASYKFIGRKTIRSECLKVYEFEKELLRKSLKVVENVSLTRDLWTSNQNICYMALVAHYIDPGWIMQCRVLNFVELDPQHTGNVIAQAMFECIAEWKIEDKIISITLDNASSNDVAARNLMAKFIARKTVNFVPEYFHVRCCAHIVNLVVQDGLESLQPLIGKPRESVKYMKKSPSHVYKFLEVCRSINLKVGARLCLDVPTRWSSTHKILSACIDYRAALTEYGQSDPNNM